MKRHNDTRDGRAKRNAEHHGRAPQSDRFHTLLALAREGNEDAIGDLWREFNFDFRREDSGHE